MKSLSSKVAYPIIITGFFSIVVFVAVNYEKLDTNFYVVLIPLTFFLFLFGFASGQKFASPVKKLLEGADYLSKGNLKGKWQLEDRDELGQLSKVFNKIADVFGEHKNQIETLDTKVTLRTKALEEIIKVLEQKIKNRTLEYEKVMEDLEKAKHNLDFKDKEIAMLKDQVAQLAKKKRTKNT